jgi:hypothetical protein
MCPNRPVAPGAEELSTGCPPGCPDFYDTIWMPPQCLAMVPYSDIDPDLIALDPNDYCGTIADQTLLVIVPLAIVSAFMCMCFLGKLIFDGLVSVRRRVRLGVRYSENVY